MSMELYDIIIIGGGPAGMTAALYALRGGKKVLVLERETVGGQIAVTPKIENYPGLLGISGSEFADNLFTQISGLGADFELENVLSVTKEGDLKKVVSDYNTYFCKALVIATGLKHRRLGLDREDELVGKGISYCAVCDGAFFKDKRVAVAGGGNTAFTDALFLSSYCEKVYIIHRRDTFRAEETLVNALKGKENVEFVLNTNITALLGGLEGLEIETGDKKSELKVDGLFIAVGKAPENGIFKDLAELDAEGYILAGEDCRTSADGVFAAGDCRKKDVRQVATAVGDGAVAGLAAIKFLEKIK